MWLVKPILLFWMQWSDKLQLFLVSWLVSWKLVFLLMSSWMCLGWSTPNTSYKCIVNPNLVGIWTTSNAFIMHLEISSFKDNGSFSFWMDQFWICKGFFCVVYEEQFSNGHNFCTWYKSFHKIMERANYQSNIVSSHPKIY